MIDRFGRTICVGWPAHHILCIEAALSLPWKERQSAFEEIAELTGRTYAAVFFKAKRMANIRIHGGSRSRLIEMSREYAEGM